MKLLCPYIARLSCRGCGEPVGKDSPQAVWEKCRGLVGAKEELLITFEVPLSDKLSLDESLALVVKQGYQRLLHGGELLRIADSLSLLGVRGNGQSLTVVQDRL